VFYTYTFSQVSFPNNLQAIAINGAINLDGQLDDSIWQVAPRIRNFTQRELNFGEPASEQTEVAIAYNQQFMYIAVWCYDQAPDQIIAKELKRDFNYDIDDNFIVILDTYNDKRNGFMFVTNPNAARADLQVFNNGSSINTFWNGVWNVKTTRTSTGWFAEFEIPFYTFKYRNHLDKQEWGINFERNIRHKREQVMWQGWSRNNKIAQVNQAGTLQGLDKLTEKRFVEIKPYVLGGDEHKPTANNPTGNIGGEINYLLSPTYRLNLTFNTDFAQVEADQQQVNITRFPIFFPELREFFLEGEDFFNMGFGGNRIIPFYSRKIGLTPNREPIPIIAGVRLLGKEENSTIGLMSLQTADALGEPTTNYTSASWRQDIGKQSVIGAMTTNKVIDGRWHTTSGLNGRYSTSKLFGNKNIDVGGAFIQTFNTDSNYQPKAFAYRAFVSYPNDKFTLFASNQRSPIDFNPEIGLMLRRNFIESFGEFAFKPRPKGRFTWIRQFEFIPINITNTQYDDTRQLQSFEYKLQFFGLETRKGERFTIEYKRVAEGLINDFVLAKDVVISKGTYWWNQYESEIRTFRGRTLSLTSRVIWGDFYDGQNFRNRTELLWRVGKFYNMNLRYEYNQIMLPSGNFVSHLIGSRMEYAINPNAFGSVLTQWNTAQNELNFNFRLQVIPKIGTDFYFIVNQIYDTQTQQLDLKRGTILGKLIWRFTL
jgi:hypothetical protein